MQGLLSIANVIDRIGEKFGWLIRWLVLAAVVISAGNALMRKAFNIGSNAFLEIQWYLFAAVFMLGAGYTLLRNAHVRIDFVSSRLSKRTNAWIDIIGIIVFLIPLCVLMMKLAWPLLESSYRVQEMSQNAGGLIRWPVLALIPLGFFLLLLQGVSELIKRFAFLKGLRPEPFSEISAESDEEKLARELAEEAAAHEEAIAAQLRAANAKN